MKMRFIYFFFFLVNGKALRQSFEGRLMSSFTVEATVKDTRLEQIQILAYSKIRTDLTK